MSVYLAGPMTGLPEHNFPAFAAAAAALRAKGIDVLSPHELGCDNPGEDWAWYMREDMKLLLQCDEIVMLPGWRDSRGATLEHHVAVALGMRVTEYEAVAA
ncbi:DUF4406 domain-containing protein [Mycobacterium gordonae]|uniref:DUF4406 domain-containing protein n=1 Tax=Mycobacterium gordonae TaxID=1778 RepID=A0A1X1WPL6_MYCGO|nr:DUF4406 domain-containing protein [Mycobacterium gordonae]MCV7004578.1 DUF4406 domain-containing protein [Mycobacterium gordonae]ORV88504.1 hypothetical protein AWC08_22200 [Mycobacterium gordonae]